MSRTRGASRQQGKKGRTDVVGLELVHADEHADGRGAEKPGRDGAEDGELARVQVVGQDVVKALRARG